MTGYDQAYLFRCGASLSLRTEYCSDPVNPREPHLPLGHKSCGGSTKVGPGEGGVGGCGRVARESNQQRAARTPELRLGFQVPRFICDVLQISRPQRTRGSIKLTGL